MLMPEEGSMSRRYTARTSALLVTIVVVALARLVYGCTARVPIGETPPGGAPSAVTTATPSLPATGAVPGAPAITRVIVSRNVDGDTLHVTMPDGTDESVRFIGVDTPESTIQHEPYGRESSDYTKGRLPVGSELYLEFDVQERDKYGRVLAYLWLEPPTTADADDVRAHMFNAELLLEGYAQLLTIPPDVKYADVFVPMQAEARDAGRGLWGLEP